MPQTGKLIVTKEKMIEILIRDSFQCYSCGRKIHGFDQMESDKDKGEDFDTIIKHSEFQLLKTKRKGGTDIIQNIVLLCDSGIAGGSSPDTKKCSGRMKIQISNWLAKILDELVEKQVTLNNQFKKSIADGKITYNHSRDEFIKEAIDFFFERQLWWNINDIDEILIEEIATYAFREKSEEIEDLIRETIQTTLDDEELMRNHFYKFTTDDNWNLDSNSSLLGKVLDLYTGWVPEIQERRMSNFWDDVNHSEVALQHRLYQMKQYLKRPEMKREIERIRKEQKEEFEKEIGMKYEDLIPFIKVSMEESPQWLKKQYMENKKELEQYKSIINALKKELVEGAGYDHTTVKKIIDSCMR